MTIRNKIFAAVLSMIIVGSLHPAVPAQITSRVSSYTATPFQATWTDISATADTFHYNRGDGGYGTITMPFDFPYDDSVIHAGSIIRIGASGAISLSSDTTPNGAALDNLAYPGFICIFSGTMVAGSGKTGSDSNFYQTNGASPNRILTVQCNNMHMPGTGGGGAHPGGMNPTAFQVKLHETSGVIEFIYLAHNNLFENDSFVYAGIGLNGFSTPQFVSNVYETNLRATPATDILWTPGLSGVAEQAANSSFEIGNCYPNPANGDVFIPITFSQDCTPRIEVRDASGALLKTISTGAMSAGDHTVEVDTKGLPSGTYFYTLSSGNMHLSRQMTIIK